ncbi:VacB/RNase II family 3'-5' exoribonuclease [Pseudomaricurvus alkylphenolicus]|uniref:VacB/RNase II family 3'-5' exoribonuclease n=1 Tax=Pseudomaricurvus alkylphenolicus TaxID=1306991 RepID=UPI001423724E|nr:VacB/RNase II family 3'-5' exoribonuclease [Pseudomaricurvus alkylphenolicus]NIB44017.1 VacB/RNase II family 3'-5' exoribonuclease [Pseudomaricurvus alkylphenolicus]
MLDSNALQQLSQLKDNIRSEKNLSEGTIRGSQGRYGFVVLDDGREAFLPPDEMARVLPGDRVEVSVSEAENKDGSKDSDRINAELDKLLQSAHKVVIGRYVIRGKGHFVAIDMPQLSRWIFLPPKARGKAKEGDYLKCRITRHPFEDGKGQAKVLDVLGNDNVVGIEHLVTCQKHNLNSGWSKQEHSEAEKAGAIELTALSDYEQRAKLQDVPFVTIDSETTRDMDDALFAQASGEGWRLTVAIADPTSSIATKSPLDRAAWQRANTAYLPGKAITMLPEQLSHQHYSLVAGEQRPALLCHMHISTEGAIDSHEFEFGIIRSAHKLSYEKVATYLEQQDESAVPADTQSLLKVLSDCSTALNSYRQNHMLLMEERDDFDLVLDDKQHIADIKRQGRNLAQQIVEESMLAANRSAGDLFAKHPGAGIFSAHQGFRSERLQNIRNVIAKDYPDLAELDPTGLEGYKALIKALHQRPEAAGQLAALRLMLQAGLLTTEAQPHLGLGMQHYATITSPIRRYNDLHNHRALRAILEDRNIEAPDAEQLADMQTRISTTRAAARDLEQWLYCLYMQQHQGKQLQAKVFRINNQGITARLVDWGITGFIKMDNKTFKYDADRMTLTGEEQSYKLEQDITVEVDKIDLEKKRVNFKLV